MKPLLSVAVLGAALALTGCDSATGPDPTATADARSDKADRGRTGGAAVYEARLRPLNADENGAGVTGTATFTIEGDVFTAMVDARNLAVDPPLGIHPQHIHAGAACPTMADDANGDGVLDVLEGVPDYGPILVSLDGDLADLSFQTSFPSATSVRGRPGYGVIDYDETESLTDLLASVEGALDDEPFNGDFGETLALETRHVVLHGVSVDTDLPGTVASLGGLPARLTLPVACGEIRRVR